MITEILPKEVNGAQPVYYMSSPAKIPNPSDHHYFAAFPLSPIQIFYKKVRGGPWCEYPHLNNFQRMVSAGEVVLADAAAIDKIKASDERFAAQAKAQNERVSAQETPDGWTKVFDYYFTTKNGDYVATVSLLNVDEWGIVVTDHEIGVIFRGRARHRADAFNVAKIIIGI